MNDTATQIAFEQALLSLDRLEAGRILAQAKGSRDSSQLVDQLIVPVLENLGSKWDSGRLALSQIYMSGRICEELVDEFLPPACPARKSQPKMAITVLEDYHLLGKRIVYSTLRASGFELSDFGRTEANGLAERAHREHIEILLISTLMLSSALRVKRVRARLAELGAVVKIIVGGAPFRFDEQLWQEVGAEGTSATASGAVSLIRSLTGANTPDPS